MYTLKKKGEKVKEKHFLTIEKFSAMWIKEHTWNQVLAVDVLIGVVERLNDLKIYKKNLTNLNVTMNLFYLACTIFGRY